MINFTFEEIRHNRLNKANATHDELNSLKMDALRKLATSLGIKRGKSRKADLITRIIKDLEPERVELLEQQLNPVQRHESVKLTQKIGLETSSFALHCFQEIQELAHKYWTGETLKPTRGEEFQLMSKYFGMLQAKYTNTHTIVSNVSKLIKGVKALINEADESWQPMYYQIFYRFSDSLQSSCSAYRIQKSVQYKEQIGERKRDKKLINVNQLVDWCESVLSNLDHYSWRDIGYALIFVTGRRPCEVFATGTFNLSEDGLKILFSGQAKTRAKANRYGAAQVTDTTRHLDVRAIPTIVDPELVVAGVAKISDKRITPKNNSLDAYEAATVKFNNSGQRKNLSRNLVKTLGDKIVGLNRDLKLKDLRPIYAQYMTELAVRSNPALDRDLYVSEIMGHTKDDFTTQLAYNSDFSVEI